MQVIHCEGIIYPHTEGVHRAIYMQLGIGLLIGGALLKAVAEMSGDISPASVASVNTWTKTEAGD